MSFDKEDVKQGIDNVAAHLKDAVDKIAEKTSESRGRVSEKAKEIARKTGDEMIEQGQKLKNAANGQSIDTSSEKTTQF
jgi:predicted transcriptional regulator